MGAHRDTGGDVGASECSATSLPLHCPLGPGPLLRGFSLPCHAPGAMITIALPHVQEPST